MTVRAIFWKIVLILYPLYYIHAQSLTCQIDVTPQSGQAVLPIECRIDVKGGTPPYRFYWDFNASDGLQVDKFHADPTFVYGRPGKYVITATVKDRDGQSVQDTVHISVLPRTYLTSEPIELYNNENTANKPYVIEGLEITNPDGCGVRLEFCQHVVIRNCWFHDVTSPRELEEGMVNAILVAKSSDVVIENCLFTDNTRGILSDAWDDYRYNYNITVRNCVMENCKLDHGIHMKNTDGIQIYNNVLRNNGDPAWFEHHRITGIICWASHHIDMHDNLVIGSTSDGLGVAADNMLISGKDPAFISKYFNIYRNTSRNNGEQGIWMSVAAYGDIYENYVEGSASCGIDLEYKILNCEIHHNTVLNSSICGIAVNQSIENAIYANTIIEPETGLGAIWVDNQRQLQIHWDYPVDTRATIIRNNLIENSLHGVMVTAGDSTIIANNTIYGCGPYYRNAEAGITVDKEAGYALIKNNIIVGNHGWGVSGYNEESVWCYNNVWDNDEGDYFKSQPGTGDISADPLFESIENHNFFLRNNSPCIDAGDPLDDFKQEPQPNGQRINMGAYGNTQFATPSFETNLYIEAGKSNAFVLFKNYPNPFNPVTTIKYALSTGCQVRLEIRNMLGKQVAVLLDAEQIAGMYHLTWDANQFASGIYWCHLQAKNKGRLLFEGTEKMMLVK